MSNNYKNLTASASVKTGKGKLAGMYVNSTSAGTIRFNDGTTGTTTAGAKATGVLTSSGVFQDGETVTLGDVIYTFKTALTGASYEVLIGASAAASLDNIKSAVNDSGTAGTEYGLATEAHPNVTATTNSATAQTFEYNSLGVVGNTFVTTETCDNVAFGAGVMASGADPSVVMNAVITPAIGYHDLGDIAFVTGCYATIASTLNVTLHYE